MSHIKMCVWIEAGCDTVFDQLGTIDGIRRWWSEDATGEAGHGGTIAVGFGGDAAQRLHVVEHRPHARVEWVAGAAGPRPEWDGTAVRFDLSPQGRGTLLSLEHTGFLTFDDDAVRCNTTWARLLAGLKLASESGLPSPERWRAG